MFRRVQRHVRFMSSFWRAIGGRLTGPVAAYLATATVSGMALTALGFYWTEHATNARIQGLFDALYLAVTTMTGVGYGDIVPITTSGRVVGMLAMLFGTAIFAGFTALFASAILEVGRDHRWDRVKEHAGPAHRS
jgi:voltage-gated potassium channel